MLDTFDIVSIFNGPNHTMLNFLNILYIHTALLRGLKYDSVALRKAEKSRTNADRSSSLKVFNIL